MDELNPDIEAFLSWLAHNRGRKDATIDKYRGYLMRLEAFLKERSTTLAEASTEDLEEFTGLAAFKAGISPSGRHPMVAAVKGFYGWWRKKGGIAMDPSKEVPYPDAGRRLPRPMQSAHAATLLKQPDFDTFIGLRDVTLMAMLMGCGMRVSGLVGLNQSSLFFERVDDRDVLVLKILEKGKRERLVPAPDVCLYLVRAYLGHPELDAIDRRLPDGDQVLFVSVRNRTVSPDKYYGEARRLKPEAVRDMLQKYASQGGVPLEQAHPHALRHLYGTHLTEQDVPTLIIQSLMGHVNPKTTEIYTHLAMGKLMKTVEKSNPLADMKTPITDLIRALRRRRK